LVEGKITQDNIPRIGVVIPNGPADKAGLKEGDMVKSIDGKPVDTFMAMNKIVRVSAGKTLQFQVARGNSLLTIPVVPELEEGKSPVFDDNMLPTKEEMQQAKLRTGFPFHRESIGLGEATKIAVSVPVEAIVSLAGVFRHPSTFKDSVSGPITITRFTYDTVKLGLPAILQFAALLSISVGIFNLLPVAPLDGGQIAMAFAEVFRRGRRLSIQVQGAFNVVGLMCMFALIICVLFVDFGRLSSGKSLLKDIPAKKSAK
jgi:regulator of sigma E protease